METIRKHIGEGFGKGELYAALAYDATDSFGGLAIKQLRFNPESGKTSITIGDSTTAVTLATYAQRAITIYTTTADDDGSENAMPVYVSATMTAAGGVGRAAEFVLNITNVKLGGWCNALKGKLHCQTTGSITGLASGICAEIQLPGGSITTGTYAGLEVQVVCPQYWSGANAQYNFMYLAASGTNLTTFDTLGNLMQIVGLSSGSGSLLYNKTLRILLDTTANYIPLSTEEGTYTTAYPISVSVSGGTALTIGTSTTGIDFTGTYTSHVLDFSDATQAAGDISLIRAGTYESPMTVSGEAQYGMLRFYLTTADDGTSYDRGIFVCLKTEGTKNIFPIAGLAEVLADDTGPAKVQAAQFIVGLHEDGSKLSAPGEVACPGMFGAWLKVYSVVGSVAASGSKVAPVWIDNQMCGTVSGEEYGIFATTGGTRPNGFIGFETSSSGYDQFIYCDTTFNSGAGTCFETEAVPTVATDARIKVWYDAKQYYIKLHR